MWICDHACLCVHFSSLWSLTYLWFPPSYFSFGFGESTRDVFHWTFCLIHWDCFQQYFFSFNLFSDYFMCISVLSLDICMCNIYITTIYTLYYNTLQYIQCIKPGAHGSQKTSNHWDCSYRWSINCHVGTKAELEASVRSALKEPSLQAPFPTFFWFFISISWWIFFLP